MLHKIELGTGTGAEPGAPPVARVTDFSGAALGAPAGFTPRWATEGSSWEIISDSAAPDGKTLRHSASAAARRLLSWDAMGTPKNLLGLVRVRASVAGNDTARLMVRASGGPGSESSVHFLIVGGNLQINQYQAGGSSLLIGDPVPVAVSDGQAVWIKGFVYDSFCAAKAWVDGEAEPSDWLIKVDSLSVLTPGWAGVGAFNPDDVRFDSLSYKALS